MTEAEKIAASLSEAQRRWVTMQGAGQRCTVRLIELGLIRRMYPGAYELLPFGLEVRRILESKSNGR